VPPTFEELDKLSSHELRQRAFKLAEHRHDLKFFWRMMKEIPAAESVEGEPDKLTEDIASSRSWLNDYLHPGHPLEEAMRPVYIDYIQTHES